VNHRGDGQRRQSATLRPGAGAGYERNLIRERTYAGLAAARARGNVGGRRRKLGEKQRAVSVDLYRQKKHTIDETCKAVGISRPTLYRYVREALDKCRSCVRSEEFEEQDPANHGEVRSL
jgi:DNA invertase Pin-like site-specific DNA recombinase